MSRYAVVTLSIAVMMLAACADAGDGMQDQATLDGTGGQAPSTAGTVAGTSTGGLGGGGAAATGGQAPATGGVPGTGGRAPATGGAPGSGGTGPGTGGAMAGGSGAVDAGGVGTGDAATDNQGGELELGTIEHSGVDCEIPELPAAGQLETFDTHHDPFTMIDGSRIASRSEWTCRRAEIKAQVEQYESGPKPAVSPESVSAQWSGDSLSITIDEGGSSVGFSVTIRRPQGAGSEPIPALIAYGFNSLDASVFSQNGVATITFSNDALGAQSGGGSRGSGVFYDLYGSDHPASSMVAWAWGVSRIIDALEATPEANIDPDRIAVTGCSRNGKGALLAGALDERIVLTIPQESGAGGSASWRVSQAQSSMGENVQTLSHAANEQPWFRADFGQNFGGANVTRLPFDHHMVMGMVAPRALLVLDNRIDWLGIDSTFTAGSVAHEIWEAFDAGDRMGYWQTGGHNHCQFPSQQRDILDAYVRKFLVGDGSDDTNMLRAENADADLSHWMQWSAPDLQ